MGKTTGFLEAERKENPWRNPAERLRDFGEMHASLPQAERVQQASRCMNCGVPFCQSGFGCPLHNLIPEWNDLLWREEEKEALERLLKTSPFPEFTGRVCPALCEKACMMAETDGASVNRDNELYLIEKGFSMGWIQPRIPAVRNGKRVAVVGSGPSGLAAADQLNQRGFTVEVFEKADRPGGLLMYGIPNMKLPKAVVERRIRLMAQEGIVFRTGQAAGPEIRAEYDAVLLCGGARRPREIEAEGRHAGGVLFAVDYLTEATRAYLEGREPLCSAKGKDVLVVGGGDTGNDCVATALRQGCRALRQLEILPAPPEQRAASNPWPEWPRILRTDYGQTEAMARDGVDPRIYETTVQSLRADPDGRLESAVLCRVGRSPEGKPVPLPETARRVSCQLLLIAAGFTGCDPETASAFDLELTPRGTPVLASSHRIGGNLFAAGDFRTGQSLVVRAIADGLEAAGEAERFLS